MPRGGISGGFSSVLIFFVCSHWTIHRENVWWFLYPGACFINENKVYASPALCTHCLRMIYSRTPSTAICIPVRSADAPSGTFVYWWAQNTHTCNTRPFQCSSLHTTLPSTSYVMVSSPLQVLTFAQFATGNPQIKVWYVYGNSLHTFAPCHRKPV